MDLFQTPEGVSAKSGFSNHVWMHGGFDILSVCVLVIAISRLPPTPAELRAAGVAALMPTLAIAWSLVATPYWNPLFIVAGAVAWRSASVGSSSPLATTNGGSSNPARNYGKRYPCFLTRSFICAIVIAAGLLAPTTLGKSPEV